MKIGLFKFRKEYKVYDLDILFYLILLKLFSKKKWKLNFVIEKVIKECFDGVNF